MIKSPFKFLDSFTLADRNIFFGRDQEITELYRKIFESKILLVYGVSGTGKSSIINCGLASRFDESDWLPLNIRRGRNIIVSLNEALNRQAITPLKKNLSVSEKLQSIYLDHFKPAYLIFDQFEELFIFGDKEERREFVQIVKSLIESDLQCRLIFVMREEYMAGVTEFEKFIPTFFTNRVRIEKMSHINAIEAIQEPCKVFNISLEEDFAETLLEKLSPENADVELTYLQVFLDKIFRLAAEIFPPPAGTEALAKVSRGKSKGGLSFTLKLLSQIGDVSDLLGSFLEEQLKELDEPDTGLTILKSFVSVKGTKRHLTQEEVIESSRSLGKDISASSINNHLQKFVIIRILRDKDDNGQYELRHDSLATKIYEKITIVEKEMLEIYQFLENAYSAYEKRKVLLSSNDLKYIAPYEDRLFLDREIAGLIENSKREVNKKKRQIRKIAIVGVVAILVFTIGTFMMIQQSYGFAFLLRWIGIIVYASLFLPYFSIYIIKVRENRTMNLLFMILTIILVVNIHLYRNYYGNRIRNLRFNRVIQHEQRVTSKTEIYDSKTDSLLTKIHNISDKYGDELKYFMNNADSVNHATNELVSYIQDLKIEIITMSQGPGSEAVDGRKIDISKIIYYDDFNVPTQILIGSKNNGEAYELSILINAYKDLLEGIVKNDRVFGPSITKTLDLRNQKIYDTGIDRQPDESWEQNTFLAKTLLVVIETLSQIQEDIKYCESEVVNYLYNKILLEIEQYSK